MSWQAVTASSKFEIPFRFPHFATRMSSTDSFVLIGAVYQRKQCVISLVSKQGSAIPFVSLFKLEDQVGRRASPAHRSKARQGHKVVSSSPRRWYPAVELLEGNEEPPGLTAKTPTRKGKGDGKARQRKHRLLDPRRRQRHPEQSSRLSRSPTLHPRAGVKRTTPSRRCARGSPHQWRIWVATRPCGRRCILGCMTRLSSARVPEFSTNTSQRSVSPTAVSLF